jgi:hypothetical protein
MRCSNANQAENASFVAMKRSSLPSGSMTIRAKKFPILQRLREPEAANYISSD